METDKLSKKSISKAISFLNNGGVVIFATDTVYGFLADAENKKAVAKIYKIKKRQKNKPLPIFVKDLKMAKNLAEIDNGPASAKGYGVAKPGKITYVLKRKNGIKLYDGGKGTIALRVPKYKPLNDLLKKINKPLVQTSVNISDQEPLRKTEDIINQFGKTKDLLFIDAGSLSRRNPSKIIDLTQNNKVLRK